MSKGGGQGSFAQMQEPGMGMDMGGFGGGGPQPAMLTQDYGFQDRNKIVPLGQPAPEPVQNQEMGAYGNGLADNLTGFIPYSPDNASGGPGRTVIGGEGLLQELRPLPQPGGFGAAMERFNNLSQRDRERLGDLRVGDIFGSGPQRVTDIQTQGPESMPRFEFNDVTQGPESFDRFSGGLGSKGGRSNPYQTDGIVPPDMGGGRVFAGGTPNFDERTGEYRTGGIKPPRGPVKLEPIKMQPMPMPAPDIPPPERMDVPAIPDDMLADIESRGTVGPGGGTRGRTGSFRDAIREFRDEFRYQPMPRPRPRPEPPIFGPPRNFPFPMPRPPRMPPRMPGRNTQFQMPFFGSQYGRMNPYAGQFSGYGVPSNMFSFAQPHYQPYVPPPPQRSAPPVMQLPPDQGDQLFSGTPVAYTPPSPVAFGGGFGGQGIGGFGRYNLGLARRQFGGR